MYNRYITLAKYCTLSEILLFEVFSKLFTVSKYLFSISVDEIFISVDEIFIYVDEIFMSYGWYFLTAMKYSIDVDEIVLRRWKRRWTNWFTSTRLWGLRRRNNWFTSMRWLEIFTYLVVNINPYWNFAFSASGSDKL